MTALYSNMEPADAQSLGQRLTLKNIRFQLSPDGKSVLVPADQLDAARLEIASQGVPHSGRLGFELFDKTNWATSDFDDKVNYQRALEGELERTIQAMSGVEAARVHLAIPPDSIYSGQDRQAKAGVILKLREHRLSAAMRVAVQRLVSSAVDKLDPQNVTVVDAEAGESSAAAGAQSAGEERSAEEVLADRLVHTLEPVVGPEHVRATVHAEFDSSTVEEQQESYDPEKTVALTMQRSEESNGGSQPGGAAGTASNVPSGGSLAKTVSSESLAQSKSENGTYAVNKIVRHSIEPAGRLKRLAVAVLVDDIYNPGNKSNPRQKRSPEELKSIEDIAKASVGFDIARGDILTVQNISFQVVSTDAPPPPTRLEKTRTLLMDWISYVRIAALLLLFGVTYAAGAAPGQESAHPLAQCSATERRRQAGIQVRRRSQPGAAGERRTTQTMVLAPSNASVRSWRGSRMTSPPGSSMSRSALRAWCKAGSRMGIADDSHASNLAPGNPQGRGSPRPTGRGDRQPHLQEPQ